MEDDISFILLYGIKIPAVYRNITVFVLILTISGEDREIYFRERVCPGRMQTGVPSRCTQTGIAVGL